MNFRLQYSQCYFNLNNSLVQLSRLNIALSLPPNNIYLKLELLSELLQSSVEILSSFERLVHIVGWLQQNFPVVIIVIVVTVMVAGTPPASPNLPTLLSAEPDPMLAAVPCV